MEFDDQKDVEDFLVKKFSRLRTLDSDAKFKLLSEISQIFRYADYPSGGGRNFNAYMVPKIYWVIRNEDMPIVESFLAGFATAATVGFFAPGSADQNKLLAAAAGLISTCYKLYKSAASKGIFVSELDYKILLCLKNNPGGLDVQRIANLLNLTKQIVSVQQLDQRLRGLQSIHTSGGSKKELVFLEDNVYKVRGI